MGKYPVYLIDSEIYYGGMSLVAANSKEEANNFIKQFKDSDPDNVYNSFGYPFLDKFDEPVDGLFSEYDGIIHYGIYYRG